MALAVVAAYWPLHRLPDRLELPRARTQLHYRPVSLPPAEAPLHLAGGWVLESDDPRFGGISALALDERRFLAVSDLGAVLRFDTPYRSQAYVEVLDLRLGPGRFGKKWSRDAESIARDPAGRGWWVGYEQRHSLWLYDFGFQRSLASVDLRPAGWRGNRGAESMLVKKGRLLVLGENGRDAVEIGAGGLRLQKLHSSADLADSALAPDGSAWVLMRDKDLSGINQSIAPLREADDGYVVGTPWPVPKARFDNYEGMAITSLPDGGLRFWLVTDDGHRIMARTLMIALDYRPPGQDKSPAPGTGLSKKPAVESP